MDAELVDLLCPGGFYKFCNPQVAKGAPTPGQVVGAHSAYPPKDPWIVKVHAYDAADPLRSRYEVKKFEDSDCPHPPVKELQLRADENMYVYTGKERPLVVVGAVSSRWANSHHVEETFLCAPAFTFKRRHPEEFIERCIGFDFPSLFYLPADRNGCSQPSAVRFEFMQPIARKALHNWASGSPRRPIALSDQAYALFVNHLSRFLFGQGLDVGVCATIDTYRQMVLEAIGGQGRKA